MFYMLTHIIHVSTLKSSLKKNKISSTYKKQQLIMLDAKKIMLDALYT